MGSPEFVVGWAEMRVARAPCLQPASEAGQSFGTEPLTCGVWVNSGG